MRKSNFTEMRLNGHRIMFLPEYYAAGKGNRPFPALSETNTCLLFSQFASQYLYIYQHYTHSYIKEAK